MTQAKGQAVQHAELPEFIARLLWDVDVARIELARDRALIFERVMSRGTWDAMKWLRRHYSQDALAEFVRTRGRKVLAPRDLAYWSLVCNVAMSTENDVGGGRPRWAGP